MNKILYNPEKLLIDISIEILLTLHFNSLIPAFIIFISLINSNADSLFFLSNSSLIKIIFILILFDIVNNYF